MKEQRVYINTTGCNNWILKIIADDIVRELSSKGILCNSGPYENYGGEEIVYHMWWRTAMPYKKANINSVFITHTDDSLKEHDLQSIKSKFDSFITMSGEDERFLIELGFEPQKVYGINLPVRNTYVRPVSLGIFSSCYPDNRKNENWILEYCSNNKDAQLLNFVFIGSGWGDFVAKLSEYGCNFEWHYVSRNLPHEYFFQQLKLQDLDYYLYMGMDGGAMGTYDAYAMSVPLCVSDDGYHKGIPDVDLKFNNKEQFFKCLDLISSKQKRRVDFYSQNSVNSYVDNIWSVWIGESMKHTSNLSDDNNYSVVEKRRRNYFSWSYQRMKQTLSARIYKFINKKYC